MFTNFSSLLSFLRPAHSLEFQSGIISSWAEELPSVSSAVLLGTILLAFTYLKVSLLHPVFGR